VSLTDRIAALTPEQRALFEKLRATQRQTARAHQPPPVRRLSGPDGAGDWPLSLDQERYWFMEQLRPGEAGLNIGASSRMRGSLSVPAVEAALAEIVRRHAAWRTTFPFLDGGPAQRVAASRRQPLGVVDLSGLPEGLREAESLRVIGEDAAAAFDLEGGPLVRTNLVRVGPQNHVCLLTAHHLIVDFTSFLIVWAELAALYAAFAAGGPALLPEPPVHYSDFAVWQREWLQGEVLADLVSWWRERLAGFPLALDLPTDRPRPAVPRMRGGRRLLDVSRELSEALRTFARQEGATLFMTVLAAVAALLHRESGQEKLILGANNANRNRPEIQPVVGTFLTQVPFPLDLTGDPTCRELLARVRQSALGTYSHQDLPFGKLVEAIQPPRDPSRQPVVQTLVQVLEGQISRTDLADVSFEAVDAYDGKARYDLMLALFDYPTGLKGSLEYDADLFDPATAERLCELLLLQAAAATADPDLRLSALPALTPAARHQVLTEWSDTARPLPGWTVPERFAGWAARTPDALAVAAAGEELTFGELGRRADALAARLRAAGVGPESRVALLLDRTAEMPVALLGVWKARGACVLLDPASPPERLAALLEDCDPAVVIHPGLRLEPSSLRQGGGQEGALPRPGDLAYMIYTSGTTGLPKAVMVEHGGLAAVLDAVAGRFGFAPGDRMPHLARFSFDISLFELFAPLLGGGACAILQQEEVLEPAALLAALARATRFHAVPSLMRQVAASARAAGAERFAGLRTLFTGGDLVPPDLLAELGEVFPSAEIAVLYGPTEGTMVCTSHPVPRGARPERTLIGRPFANAGVRVIDRWGDAPLGVPGELWIGGPGVARGYFRRGELTAERFVELEGRRYYRSGDLVRLLADGTLEFLGRTDLQVKVRGFRVEPGEVEAALLAHPAVREAVVVARADPQGEKRLVAYCVPAGEGGLEPAALRALLTARLPAYMVPSSFVLLPELPVTAHGKLDRSRLPAPAGVAEPEETAGPPRTPTEELVAGIWCEVLGLPRVSRSSDFFALGGQSLLATQVATRLREALGAEVPVRTLFQAPVLAALAAEVDASLARGAFGAVAPPILPVPREGDLPLSFAQERLWLVDKLTPGRTAYNIPLALGIYGVLSVAALEAALGEVVRRHETLRTTFRERESRPAQVIAPPAGVLLPWVDLSALPAGRRAIEARRLAGEEAARPFDLESGPVLRATLLRIAAGEHALLLDIHHIAADGWSMGVLVAEVAALYGAALAEAPSPLPELTVQYADFAVWQRRWLAGEVLERQLGYWRERLADAPALVLPTDRPRPARSFQGRIERFALGAERTAGLIALARRYDATLFMALLAAFQALLGRYTGQDDLVLGSPIANRTRSETEGLIGFFVNSLVLRGDLGGDPGLRALLARARGVALEAYGHQDLPFERLVEELRPERRLAQNPLFQVVCALQNAPLNPIVLPGLELAPIDYDLTSTRFDLELMFWETGEGLAGQITYATDLFDPATVRRLASHFGSLVDGALADPDLPLSRLPLLAGPERHQLLREWNDTARPEPAPDVVALCAGWAARTPEAPAVVSAGGTLTCAELDRRAGGLARRLRSLGVGPDVPVGLYAPRSPEMVIGALAVLKAGGAYVPLDPAQPADRLAFVVRESRMPVILAVLAKEGAPGWVEEGVRVVPISEAETGGLPMETFPAAPESLAYVIYTSGSTGRPKGVEISRAGLANLVRWHLRTYGVTPRDRATQVASPAFDAAVWEVWSCLAAGAALHIPDEETRLLPERLLASLAAGGITLCFLPTPLAEQFLDAAERALPAGLALRALLTGGDRLVRVPRRPLPFALVNHYGPTESSVVATWAPVPSAAGDGPPAIGRPVDGTAAYVLDRGLDPVPAGVPGELAIGGAGLARGYLGRPDLTAERFIPDPFGAGRLYRTGDLVRQRPDGALEFLGRIDHQVKIRGFRVEPGEIEGALARHPEVREAAVVLREGAGGGRLVAYVVPKPKHEGPVAASDVAGHVAQWQTLYDETYGRGPSAEGGEAPAFNLQGWDSSYTGEPIPAAEMREWVDGTVGRLLALPHRRVLEVGCGTGLLLFRVAPEAERYRSTDFSAVALEQIRAGLERLPLPQVELVQGLADDWSGARPGDFELVVLNSVVQYFPGVDYLVKVLEGAVAAVAPGGAVFVGDVRSLPLLAAFHASVQLHRAADSLPAAELARRVGRQVAGEEELAVDPALFLALARRLPAIRRIEVLLKRGRHANELTRFRYDVILHVGQVEEESRDEPRSHAWESPGALERFLDGRPAALAVSGIPNSRLAGEVAALELLAGGELETAGELRAEIERRARAAVEAIDPEDLWALADRLGYDADLTWSAAGGADGRFDAILRRRGAGVPAGVPVGVTPREGGIEDLPWTAYANDPLRANQERRLVPELRRFVESAVPEYMVPSAIVLLDALPLTANGKVDRSALPAPEGALEPAGEWVAPATPLEQLLARVVGEVLGVERVGLRDNFFDLGGHSLLATQLVSRLIQRHDVPVTLQMVFDAKDLGVLADRIVEAELASEETGFLDEALSEMKDLSPEELQTMLEQVEGRE
jgi:amino acid adenylation domain-containing protein